MSHATMIRFGLVGLALALLGLRSATVQSDPMFTFGAPPSIAQDPLYMQDAVPPLNMLVMGKDHKIYYEAYNDASDLNGDNVLDVGYKPALDYYGYFNSHACYNWDTGNGGRFVPASASANKQCVGAWSGDFLNYLTTSRMDALRRVLYGGWRNVDTASETVLQGAFFPQDAHSWGKEYRSVARDGYDIRSYSPLSLPADGRYHLFAVTTVTGNANTFPNYQAPLFRVLKDAPYRVWEWVSIEGPVANRRCLHGQSGPLCQSGGGAPPHPGHPGSRAAFDSLVTTFATPANRFGSGNLTSINCNANDCNPFGVDDNFLTLIEGQLVLPPGNMQLRVDGDDVIDFQLRRANGNVIVESGCYNTAGRGFGACTNAEKTPVFNPGNNTHNFTFRQEEGAGGDGYRLEYRACVSAQESSCGAWLVVPSIGPYRLQNTTITTYNLTPTTNGTTRDDYLVRVQTCPANAALRETACKTYPGGAAYPGGTHKPTGILHDYGENQRMYFGLITGSQRNNLEGGVLRSNVANFAREIDPDTGVFRTDVEGIVRSIDRLRMIGGAYGSGTDNTNADSNWNWANGNGNCLSQGNRSQNNGECRMWGNPIAEMMYEGLRYFAGAREPTARFSTTGGSTAGNEDVALGLPSPAWDNPYGNTAGDPNYPACAKPNQTIISDINPSYDGDLPGSPFAGAITTTGLTPAAIAGFNAANEGQEMWNAEGGGSRRVFIGEVGAPSDGAPTPKTAASFGNIRGLAPEEPTKGGTFYSASVARFGRMNDVNAAPTQQNVSTYSIALASPLPRIEFPIGTRNITLLPFAKTATGTFGDGARKPTNTIVDFYVEEYANFPGQPINVTINGGRPRAVFRINYEDVEQGNDHDMDAIVRYEVIANANSTATINLTSEYAAGSADQVIGYVISGTTRDGVYLEVKDRDAADGPNDYVYQLNTPPGVWAGGCVGVATAPCNVALPLTATRTFNLNTTGDAPATQLRNPLWYAAKYGAPDPVNWDTDPPGTAGHGEPDNYFLVTNPLNLREQLSEAFDDIADRDLDVGNRSISGARVQSGSFTLEPSFTRRRDSKDWVGDLTAVAIYPDGSLAPDIWNAQSKLDARIPDSRNIRTLVGAFPFTRSEFKDTTEFGATPNERLGRIGVNPVNIPSVYGAAYTSADMIGYLRGDRSREAGDTAVAGDTLRERSAVLGDIINSEPVIYSPRSDFGYAGYSGAMFTGYADTGTSGYLRDKRSRKPVVYVGANDGMLHAFDASTQECTSDEGAYACAMGTSGDELFGFVPHGVLSNMGKLALPDINFDHRYYVDGQIAIGDAKNGVGTWKTLLVGSTGAGGRSIFALDVTNIDNRTSFTNGNILWERNATVDNDIGHIYGKPLLVPLENDQWGVLFGNGYGGNRSDPSLYILDAFDGSQIAKITGNDGNRARTLLGTLCELVSTLLPVNCSALNPHPYNGLGQITALDRNGNGKVDTVYGGDLQGNLWKFDLRSTNEGSWNVFNFATGGRVPLFTGATGTERQPITGGIRVSAGPGTGVMVFFGTGRYFVEGDNEVSANPQVQSVYGIFDNSPVTGNVGSSPVGTRASLLAQTIDEQLAVVVDGQPYDIRNISMNRVRYFGTGSVRGWYLDLKLAAQANGSGERFIATPRVQSGRVFFTTYEPDENGTGCAPGGTNWQYGLDLVSGAGALANLSILGEDNPACTNDDCGGVAVRDEDGNRTMPPITNTGIVATRPTVLVPSVPPCDPAVDPSCPTFEQCQVVIYPGAFVLPRPCGRQSWRQLK